MNKNKYFRRTLVILLVISCIVPVLFLRTILSIVEGIYTVKDNFKEFIIDNW